MSPSPRAIAGTASPSVAPATRVPIPDDAIVPLGSVGDVGDWSIRIARANLDADSAILAANPFNEPPPDGYLFVMIYVTATYDGDGSEALDPAGFRAVGDSGTAYTTFLEPTCGLLPTPSLSASDPAVPSGGSVEGWAACWAVEEADVPSLIALWSPVAPAGREPTYFALR